ncbi:AI-2E family transporter [Piscinibacter sp. XHJ-5]|uniref:AI-2E family transporter n=1 Tax=Piscinibacter sp. XHJ-5 TaxID=3037797 RepID=UPI002452DEC3|nr:AI-2E family transporter [Piscinibacter sp. XHJ-5]
MHIKLTPGRVLATATVILSVWIVHAFIQAVLAACVIAIASWPLYARFKARLPRRLDGAAPAVFTCVLTAFVLAPMAFAFGSLLVEAHSMLSAIAAANSRGLAVPDWVANAPVVGPWAAARWQSELAHPGALLTLMQRTNPGALLGYAQSLGQFTARHVLIVGFTILLLGFLFQEGESLARHMTRALQLAVGERAQRYVEVATRAVQAAVSSMLVVGLFDGLATAFAYAMAGVPRAMVWGAITGALAAVPFLGYAAVAAMAVDLTVRGAASSVLLSVALGCVVLLCGDKVVRPMVARGGLRLPFVWVLMGCLGGFQTLGLAGLVIGPVVLGLARELWDQRVRELASRAAPP